MGPRIQHPQKTYARYNSSHLISHRQRIRRVDYASFRDLHDENHRNIVTRLFSDGEALRRRLDIFIEKMGQLIKTDPDEMDWEHCNQTIILEGKRSTVAGESDSGIGSTMNGNN